MPSECLLAAIWVLSIWSRISPGTTVDLGQALRRGGSNDGQDWVPRRGRLACHSRIVAGNHAGERPNIRSGSGAWPRDTYPAHVARLIGTPEAFRNFRTSGVVH